MFRCATAMLFVAATACGASQERKPLEGEDAPVAAEPQVAETPADDKSSDLADCGRNPASDEEIEALKNNCGGLRGDSLAARLPKCGAFDAPREQRRRYELPVYIEIGTEMLPRVEKMVLNFAFACDSEVYTTELTRSGAVFGGGLTCDRDQLRIFAPAQIYYYLVGHTVGGEAVCTQGSASDPFVVLMTENACPLPGIPGLRPPEYCDPCPPYMRMECPG